MGINPYNWPDKKALREHIRSERPSPRNQFLREWIQHDLKVPECHLTLSDLRNFKRLVLKEQRLIGRSVGPQSLAYASCEEQIGKLDMLIEHFEGPE